ncbi:MAG: MNIO family bufferin maturase [Alphaproteobacteria bacterium]
MTMQDTEFPQMGYGLGFRPTHFSYIKEHKPDIDWFEVISENYMDTGGKPRRLLDELREHYPIVMHGVSLSIGTVDPINSEYIAKLRKLIDDVNPKWVSDHLCWTGVAHKNSHDLLPVPYTDEALKHIIERIKQVQDALGRRIILENPSTYLEFTASTMTEWDFIKTMAEEADCGLLLDVNNIYVSCYNHRWDPKTYIDALPLDRVQQIHLAGHTNKGTHIVDTHDDHVIDEVWTMYRYIIEKGGFKNTMVEWDDKIPEFPVVMEEVDKAKHWASADHAPTEMPSFQSFRDNIRPSEKLTPYEDELGDMQEAILSGDGEHMSPQTRIVPKPDFAPEEQIDRYIKGYRYRLFDLVYDDYPALRALLGKPATDKLIREYVQATPSTHFNISRYVEHFPDYVRDNASPFAYELCVLETALSRIFDAQESAALTQDDLTGLTPESFMEMELKPRAALKLFAFSYPVNAVYQAHLNGEGITDPEKETSFLAVFRHEDKLWRLDLEEREYMVLSSLFAGLPVGEALNAAISDDDETAFTAIGDWFSKWMGNGLLAKAA